MTNTVKIIGKHTFSNCIHLKKVHISATVQLIDDHAFNGCKKLTEVTLPDTLTCIGDGAFSNSGLLACDLPPGLKSIPAWVRVMPCMR